MGNKNKNLSRPISLFLILVAIFAIIAGDFLDSSVMAAELPKPGEEEPPPPALAAKDREELASISQQLRAEARSLRSRAIPEAYTVQGALKTVPGQKTPGDIFRWIREYIAFEPYFGALRGPEGALVAGSANAVDQALLAAAMLKEAGYTYRFASGRLHTRDAERLLAEVLGSKSLISGLDGTPRSFVDSSTFTRRAIVSAVEEHMWVEVLFDGEYRPLDPLAAPLFGMTPARAEQYSARIPENFQTSMQIALISHLDDGQTIEHFRVRGSLPRFAYRSLSLSFEDDPTRQQGLRPILQIGDEQAEGESIPVQALQTMELQFQLWIGQRESRWQQPLFRRDRGRDIFDFDHQHFGIAIIPGWTSAAQVRLLAGEAAENSLDAFDRWLNQENPLLDSKAQRRQTNAIVNDLGATLPFAFARVLDRTTLEIADHFGVLAVLGRPRVVTTGLLRRGDEFVFDLHLSGDRLDALPRPGVPAIAAPAFLGMQGQIRDQLVGEILEIYGGRTASTVDRIFSEATRQGIRFTTVEGRSMSNLELVQVDGWVNQAIRRMIRRRSLFVLAPLQPVSTEGVERYGWWALDPISGALEPHTSDALLSMDAGEFEEELPLARHLRGHLGLVARHFAAAAHATSDENRFSELSCTAGRRLRSLGRAFCATSRPLSPPDLDSCLDSPPQPGADLLTLGNMDCREQLEPFRCATAYAGAILDGTLLVGPAEFTPQSLPLPLCQ